jgi:hypothetical protein
MSNYARDLIKNDLLNYARTRNEDVIEIKRNLYQFCINTERPS